jgi:putative DNA primase/helicase
MANKKTKRETGSRMLLSLAKEAYLFVNHEGIAHADIKQDGRSETWLIDSSELRNWLTNLYFAKTGDAPSKKMLEAVLNVLQAKASSCGNKHDVFVRIGYCDDRLYVDSCDTERRIYEITKHGWQPAKNPPIRFVRTPGMQALPMPVSGGDIEKIKKYINVSTEEGFVMLNGWLLGALNRQGPYPVLMILGDKGSGKSSAARRIKALIDPSDAPLRAAPRSEDDLVIAASKNRVLAIDNLSHCGTWQADAFCRLATGGSTFKRKLYTNDEEFRLSACRPVILTGIEKPISRSDLDSRSVFLKLEPIKEGARKSERSLDLEFENDKGEILGALFDALVVGLSRIETMEPQDWPRMADAAEWITACETHFWTEGTFLELYKKNTRRFGFNSKHEAELYRSILWMMDQLPSWEGTATALREELSAQPATPAWLDWDRIAPNKLSRMLNSIIHPLIGEGVSVTHAKVGPSGERRIRLSTSKTAKTSDATDDKFSASFSSSPQMKKGKVDEILSSDRQREA